MITFVLRNSARTTPLWFVEYRVTYLSIHFLFIFIYEKTKQKSMPCGGAMVPVCGLCTAATGAQ